MMTTLAWLSRISTRVPEFALCILTLSSGCLSVLFGASELEVTSASLLASSFLLASIELSATSSTKVCSHFNTICLKSSTSRVTSSRRDLSPSSSLVSVSMSAILLSSKCDSMSIPSSVSPSTLSIFCFSVSSCLSWYSLIPLALPTTLISSSTTLSILILVASNFLSCNNWSFFISCSDRDVTFCMSLYRVSYLCLSRSDA